LTTRRFPPPWSAELQPNYYVVRDADGQQIAYICYSNDPDRRSAAKLLTKDEARRIAANIAKLPDFATVPDGGMTSRDVTYNISGIRGALGTLSNNKPCSPFGPQRAPPLQRWQSQRTE
jgi:hypothetical protein